MDARTRSKIDAVASRLHNFASAARIFGMENAADELRWMAQELTKITAEWEQQTSDAMAAEYPELGAVVEALRPKPQE